MPRLLESRSRIRSQIEKLHDAFPTRGKNCTQSTREIRWPLSKYGRQSNTKVCPNGEFKQASGFSMFKVETKQEFILLVLLPVSVIMSRSPITTFTMIGKLKSDCCSTGLGYGENNVEKELAHETVGNETQSNNNNNNNNNNNTSSSSSSSSRSNNEK